MSRRYFGYRDLLLATIILLNAAISTTYSGYQWSVCTLVDVNQRKAVEIILDSDRISSKQS